MDRRIPLFQVAVSLLVSCTGHPAAPSDADTTTFSGKVVRVDDTSELDGPVVITIESATGETIELYFPSMWTKPSPDAERKATFRVVRSTKVGDAVRARGVRTDAGQVWLQQLENLRRN